jgi:hypothetical protein
VTTSDPSGFANLREVVMGDAIREFFTAGNADELLALIDSLLGSA